VGAVTQYRLRKAESGVKKKRSHHKIDAPFVPHTFEMLRSPAWRVLSLTAHRILSRIEIELGNHGGRDNGKLPVTYADLRNFGIRNSDDIARGIRELRALGIIELTRPGRAGNGEFRAPNLFRLTYLPAYGKAPTNEWRQFETVETAEQAAQKSRKPVTENVSGPDTENVSVTGHGKLPETPKSPDTENCLLSRKALAIYQAAGLTRDHPHHKQRAARRARHRGRATVFHRTNKGGHHGKETKDE
jgi:hypothetical protein